MHDSAASRACYWEVLPFCCTKASTVYGGGGICEANDGRGFCWHPLSRSHRQISKRESHAPPQSPLCGASSPINGGAFGASQKRTCSPMGKKAGRNAPRALRADIARAACAFCAATGSFAARQAGAARRGSCMQQATTAQRKNRVRSPHSGGKARQYTAPRGRPDAASG